MLVLRQVLLKDVHKKCYLLSPLSLVKVFTFNFQNFVFLLRPDRSRVPVSYSGMLSGLASPPMIDIGVIEWSRCSLLVFSLRSFFAIFLSDKLLRKVLSFMSPWSLSSRLSFRLHRWQSKYWEVKMSENNKQFIASHPPDLHPSIWLSPPQPPGPPQVFLYDSVTCRDDLRIYLTIILYYCNVETNPIYTYNM